MKIKFADADVVGKARTAKVYAPFIEAALKMPKGKAVIVDIEGRANLLSCVRQAITSRNLSGKLMARTKIGTVYILHKEIA